MGSNSPQPYVDRPALSRRRLLQIGGLGAFGLSLGNSPRAEALGATATGTRGGAPKPIKSCILMFHYGGPSHLDTWDMKPEAPSEVRGEFGSIETSVPGLRIGEHLPHCARIADRLAIVRSMHHPMRNHNSAAVEALCGRTPLRGDLELLANDPATDFPCYGSAVSRLGGCPNGLVPPFVALPHVMYNVVMLPGQTAGFLGSSYEPLQVTRDPNANDFRVAELELPSGLSTAALGDREALLSVVDAQARQAEMLSEARPMDAYYRRAFDLLRSDTVRRSFDISQEDPATRERYGRTKLGQSALLARRLVEGGVRFVSVYDKITNGLDNWDTHIDNFGRLKKDLLPPADRALAALVEDLDERGLLDTTLVVVLGEFGRTPRLNNQAGRDHWPDCFSVVLAGGGVKGSLVYGASDKLGGHVDLNPVTPGDLAATLFWRFGLDPADELRHASGRRDRLAEGEPIRDLFV